MLSYAVRFHLQSLSCSSSYGTLDSRVTDQVEEKDFAMLLQLKVEVVVDFWNTFHQLEQALTRNIS